MTETHNVTSLPSSKRKLPTKQQIVRGTALVATGAAATLVIIAVTKKAPVLEVAADVTDVVAS